MKLLLGGVLLSNLAWATVVQKVPTVCFSPGGGCATQLAAMLSDCQTSIDMAIYDINEPSIVSALLAQKSRCKIRIVVDKKQSSSDKHSAVAQLSAAGIPVHYGRQKGIMHNKFVLTDSSALETGSFNYTANANLNNNENMLFISAPSLVSKYQDRFETIWTASTPVN